MLVSQVVLQKSLMIILLDCWYSITGVTFWKRFIKFLMSVDQVARKIIIFGLVSLGGLGIYEVQDFGDARYKPKNPSSGTTSSRSVPCPEMIEETL